MKYVLLVLVILFLPAPAWADPVMDRINETQTIRCGYVPYPIGTVKDTATGKLSGYNIDLMEEAAKRLGLEIDWAYESNWPTLSEDLRTDKFDVLCVGYWTNPRSARQMLTTDPIYYQPVFFATRADDARFDKDLSKINDPAVKIALLEYDVPETIVNEMYPKAGRTVLPPSAPFIQIFQEVATHKADVTIAALPDMAGFEANNPGKLKMITDKPVRIYGCVMVMLPGATQLQNALNTTFREMQLDGTVAKILKKHAVTPHDYYLVDLPHSPVQ